MSQEKLNMLLTVFMVIGCLISIFKKNINIQIVFPQTYNYNYADEDFNEEE